MLDFVDELVDWVTELPLFVVGTARPELLESRPNWGGGKLNASTLALGTLVRGPDTDPDHQAPRAVSVSRGHSSRCSSARAATPSTRSNSPSSSSSAAPPTTCRSRRRCRGSSGPASTDSPETRKSSFTTRRWSGRSSGGRAQWEGSRRSRAARARAKGLSAPAAALVGRGEIEFAFAHALVRDVAYGQLARAERGAKHRSVAEWLESLGRPEDHAECSRTTGAQRSSSSGRAAAPTRDSKSSVRHASAKAGDRAASLNAYAAAAAHYAGALELAGDDDPALLFKRAEALFNIGDEGAAAALERARDALLASGDRPSAASAEALLARLYWYRGEHREMSAHLRAAEALVEGEQPSLGVARVLAWSARQQMLAGDLGDQRDALQRAQAVLAIAEQIGGLDDLRVHALTTIGTAKANLGDMSGRGDLELAVDIGRSAGSALVAGALNNLGVVVDSFDAVLVQRLQRESLEEAERFGEANLARFARGNLISLSFFLGEWDDAMRAANEFIAECELGSPHVLEGATTLVSWRDQGGERRW